MTEAASSTASVPELIAELNSEDPAVRARAAEALGDRGDLRAIRPLTELLRRDLSITGPAAALALGKLGDRRGVPALIGVLSGARAFRRRLSRGAVRAMRGAVRPEPAAPWWPGHVVRFVVRRLAWKLLGRRPGFRMHWRDWLAYVGQRNRLLMESRLESIAAATARTDACFRILAGERDELIALAGEALHQARAAAEEALVMIGEPAVGPLLAAVARDPDTLLPAAGRILKRIGEPAVRHLRRAMRNRTWRVRELAVEVLGGAEAVAAAQLVPLLRDRVWKVRAAAALGLGSLGAPALPALLDTLEDPDPGVRELAVAALVQIAEPAVEPLLERLPGSPGAARDAVVEALGRLGDRRAVLPLLELLRERSAHALLTAGTALARLGEEWAVEALEELACSDDPNLREAAAARLRDLRGEVRTVELPEPPDLSFLDLLREATAMPQVPQPAAATSSVVRLAGLGRIRRVIPPSSTPTNGKRRAKANKRQER